MPKRNANSDSDSAEEEEEEFSEYSDEDESEAESDADPDKDKLVVHQLRKPQRPVALETRGKKLADGDRGLSESEDAESEKPASSGEHPEDAGREDVEGLGSEFGVVQNKVPAAVRDRSPEGPLLNGAEDGAEVVKESGSDEGEVLGEIVECEEGEAPVRPKVPPHVKKALTKRDYPSDSDVSLPDSPKAGTLPKALNGRTMKIETIDPEDDEESEDEEGGFVLGLYVLVPFTVPLLKSPAGLLRSAPRLHLIQICLHNKRVAVLEQCKGSSICQY